MSNQNRGRLFGGRGYSIALILCACVVGISGYVFYRTQDRTPPQDTPVLATEDMPVSVYRPGPTEATAPQQSSEPEPTGPSRLRTCAPVAGEVLTAYAAECLSYNETTRDWRTHTGLDLGAEPGTEVVAAADGEVYTVYEDDRMGTTVVIRHEGGYTTKYQSLAAGAKVVPGEQVSMGQPIGTVGTTALMESALGDHVHFSVTKDDVAVDPETFLGP